MRTADMPHEMQALLRTYPRDSWEAHPGFRDKTRQWLSAHQNFRALAERVRLDTELMLDKDMALDDYTARLSFLGGRLVGNLHGHHGWCVGNFRGVQGSEGRLFESLLACSGGVF